MENKYYHITAIENVESILLFGILANDEGEIFVFENKALKFPSGKVMYVADSIALHQLGLEKFAMFEILSKGIRKEPVNDNVAELTARFQWIVKQPKIARSYIKLFGIFETESENRLLSSDLI